MKELTKKVVILNNFSSPYVSEAIIFLKEYNPKLESRAIADAETIVSRYIERIEKNGQPSKTARKKSKFLNPNPFLFALHAPCLLPHCRPVPLPETQFRVKRVKGRAPCGVWGRAPGSFVFPNTKRAVRRVTPRRTALLYKSDFFVSKAVYASASAASFMEKFKRPCLSISISFTITLSPTVSTSSTFATRLLEILEM